MKRRKSFFLLAIILFVLSSCSNVPHQMKDAIYTEAALTVVAQMTETAEAFPQPSNTPLPTNTATATSTMTVQPIQIPTQPPVVQNPTESASSANPYQVEFVWVDPYPTQFRPGQNFTLTWTLKNVGSAIWSGKYRFYHRNGIQLANQQSYPINTVVGPNESLTISLPATAPSDFGTYQTEWAFANPEGVEFYYVYYTAIVGENTFITEQPGNQPTSTPNTLYWMCADANRSVIQGNGCEEFCRLNGTTMLVNNLNCYANGKQVTDFQ